KDLVKPAKTYKEKALYVGHISKAHYKKVYNKYVKGYTRLAGKFKNGTSVKDSSAIENYGRMRVLN
ncbi:MAG: hypothetical protein ACI4LM_07660, partial [Anaerovoracaceae bacterium]